MKKWIFILSLLGLASSCQKSEEHADPVQEISVEEIADEIMIPEKLWDLIEQGDASAGHEQGAEGHGQPAGGGHGEAAAPEAEHGGGGHGGPATAAESAADRRGLGAMLMPITVVLSEKSPGVLTRPNVRIKFPRGGGKLDLAKWVNETPGTFYVQFELPDLTTEQSSSWFVSRTRARRFDGEIWGAGCRQFVKLPNDLTIDDDHHGLKLNTTQDRHLTVAGGSFIFNFERDKQTRVAQVTITDSRKPELFCPEVGVKIK